MGGETRGVFVNKTLLKKYDLSVPENYTEFLNCCEILKNAGLTPIQGAPNKAAYGLGLAPAANAIVHNEEAFLSMKEAKVGTCKYFEDTLNKIYSLATNRFFDYKAIEEQGYFVDTSELGQAQSFLGIQIDKTTFEVNKPENNYGNVAFFPYISSTETVIQELIDEYQLDTEFEFICSPLNEEGTNRPVYITPYYGICANKNSEELIWIREFVNFLFQEKNNKLYAENASIIPNTTDALQYVSNKYDVDADTDVTLCGQIRFSDEYNGYSPIASALTETFKCSAQKYMINLNCDADGKIGYSANEEGKECLLMDAETEVLTEYVGPEDDAMPGYAFCTMEYYLEFMEKEFAKYRVE